MAKYEYWNGERRYHHGTTIWYDLTGDSGKHWYIRQTIYLDDSSASKFKSSNVYFQTLSEAKRYIDGF